LPAHLPFEVN